MAHASSVSPSVVSIGSGDDRHQATAAIFLYHAILTSTPGE